MIMRYTREKNKEKDERGIGTGYTDVARPSTRALSSPLSAFTKINKKTKRIIRGKLLGIVRKNKVE